MTTKPNREPALPTVTSSSEKHEESTTNCGGYETQVTTNVCEDSSDAEQDRLRKLYLQQQQRLACPGCGESPFLG